MEEQEKRHILKNLLCDCPDSRASRVAYVRDLCYAILYKIINKKNRLKEEGLLILHCAV